MNFQVYRYHLSPISTNNVSLTIDGENKVFSAEELKQNKNDYFIKALHNVDYNTQNNSLIKIEFEENNIFTIKLANKKPIELHENFEKKKIDTFPFAYILINNDDKIQKIAISANNAFSTNNMVRKTFIKLIEKELEKHGISIKIEGEFDAINIWKTIRTHRDDLKYIQIKYIKPNLADISGSLDQAFKDYANNLNSHESTIEFKAPSDGTLENINENNTVLKGLVDYTSNGGGSVKIGIKGYSKKVSSKDNPVEIQIDEVTLESQNGTEIVSIIKELLK